MTFVAAVVGGALGYGVAGTLGGAAIGAGLGGMLGGSYGQAQAAQNAAQMQNQAAQNAINLQSQMFNTQNAQQAPYRAAGYSSLNQILGGLTGSQPIFDSSGNVIGQTQGTGQFTSMPTAQQIASMPGYQFTVQQGEGAARQGANVSSPGSNADRAAQQFAINYTMQQALPQYMAQQNSIYNRLASIAGLGQTAQGQTTQLASNVANAQSQLGVGGATALGAGQIGAANAYAGMGSQLGNAGLLYSLLNPGTGGTNVGSMLVG